MIYWSDRSAYTYKLLAAGVSSPWSQKPHALADPAGRGSMDLDYDLNASGEIEIPKCLAGAR